MSAIKLAPGEVDIIEGHQHTVDRMKREVETLQAAVQAKRFEVIRTEGKIEGVIQLIAEQHNIRFSDVGGYSYDDEKKLLAFTLKPSEPIESTGTE